MVREIIRQNLVGVVWLWLDNKRSEETWSEYYVYAKDMGLRDTAYGLMGKRVVVRIEIEDDPLAGRNS